jgi:hypothetical protein
MKEKEKENADSGSQHQNLADKTDGNYNEALPEQNT